jgi:Kef-type K+ transport system membrane component KefB
MSKLDKLAWETYNRLLSGGDEGAQFGVHIEYTDLYKTVVFLVAIYVSGQLASRFLKMPDLVGEIICGIVMGPELLDFVHNPEAWVMFGELGYVLYK